jgi:hypothetical protein
MLLDNESKLVRESREAKKIPECPKVNALPELKEGHPQIAPHLAGRD